MIDYKYYFENGLVFDNYFESMQGPINPQTTEQHALYIPLNIQRSKRILKTFKAEPQLQDVIEKLPQQNWLVISEHWCGDASQIVPVLYKLSALNSQIKFRTIYRDEFPSLIDAHLTNGSKSIPLLLILDSNYQLLATYGPRPKAAQQLVLELKSKPETAENYAEALHTWYAKNKSVAVQEELLKLFKTLS
ncbi:MAG: thioredoxin family protein [Bacteroidia bacterium]|nr:thioredoxin family protein [Bacteroidia bacterium]